MECWAERPRHLCLARSEIGALRQDRPPSPPKRPSAARFRISGVERGGRCRPVALALTVSLKPALACAERALAEIDSGFARMTIKSSAEPDLAAPNRALRSATAAFPTRGLALMPPFRVFLFRSSSQLAGRHGSLASAIATLRKNQPALSPVRTSSLRRSGRQARCRGTRPETLC
jgi:hypothetical protein